MLNAVKHLYHAAQITNPTAWLRCFTAFSVTVACKRQIRKSYASTGRRRL